MATKRCLMLIALLAAASSAALAQPAIVNIQLRPGEPRTIEVTPNASAVCRNTANCPTEINLRWLGPPPKDATERISVEYKAGLYFAEDGTPAQIEPKECFSFPGDANPFDLEHGAANGRNLVFRSDAEACPDKVAFFFDISCQNKAGDNCGGVKTLDPATMIDNGRR